MLRYMAGSLLIYIIYNLIIWKIIAHPTASATSTATYDTKYDNIDIDELLQNERLLNNYVKCLEGKGPCTPDGKMLKETLPDAIETDCSKCSEKQKTSSDKVTRYLIDNRPEDWARLEKLYDVEGTYRKAYLAEKAQKAVEAAAEEKEKS